MQELATTHQTIAMMQDQMERLECIIMTQHNAQKTNVAIGSVGEIQKLTRVNMTVVSAGIVQSPLTVAQGAHALQGQESEATVEDGHKPG